MSRLGRILGWPVRRLLDRRVAWIVAAVDERLAAQRADLLAHIDGTAARLSAEGAAASRQHAERLAEVRHAGDEDRMVTDEAFAAILEHLQALDRAVAELDPSYLIPAPDARALADLRAPAADYVNWAQGIRGYAHQAGLWVNHPESIAVAPGRARVKSVNERIVENAFAFAAIGMPPPALRVLDVGGCESTVALSLASAGHAVTVVDPNPYPFAHRNLRAHRLPLADLPDDAGPFDVVLALSSIEHFGRPHYGQPELGGRPDIAALDRIAALLAADGRLVATFPYAARARIDDLERTYDADGLAQLLDGWRIERQAYALRASPTEWVVAGREDIAADADAVTMLTARPPRP